MSTISKRKDKRFDIEAYYRNESKTFWSGLLTMGTKAKHIDLVQKKFCCKQIISVLAQKFWDEANQFFWSGNCLRQIRTFLFNPKTNRVKQKVLIWFAYYRNESKIFCFGLLIIGTKAKHFDLVCFLSELKAKHFDLVCLLSELKQNILI
jgi:hypothetical protein